MKLFCMPLYACPRREVSLEQNGGKIIECVQVANNERGVRLNALELFLPEKEPAGLTEFICHTAGDGLRVYDGQED